MKGLTTEFPTYFKPEPKIRSCEVAWLVLYSVRAGGGPHSGLASLRNILIRVLTIEEREAPAHLITQCWPVALNMLFRCVEFFLGWCRQIAQMACSHAPHASYTTDNVRKSPHSRFISGNGPLKLLFRGECFLEGWITWNWFHPLTHLSVIPNTRNLTADQTTCVRMHRNKKEREKEFFYREVLDFQLCRQNKTFYKFMFIYIPHGLQSFGHRRSN